LGRALYWLNMDTPGRDGEDSYDNLLFFVEQAAQNARRR